MTKRPGAHYYYNVARCKIGGGVQVDKEPFIRGPLVFAVDEHCSSAYYFLNGWKEYRSGRNLNCSAHGKEKKEVTESDCLEGSVDGSTSSFIYLPFGATKVSHQYYNLPRLVMIVSHQCCHQPGQYFSLYQYYHHLNYFQSINKHPTTMSKIEPR